MKTLLAGLLTVIALSPSGAFAAEQAVNSGEAAFMKLQQLIGEWEAALPGDEVMKNVFRPFAFGTALAHEEWKNGEQLTATVFYVVGSQLHADHFCDMGNQLRYVAAPSADGRTFQFALRDATNLDTHPRHFRSTTWQLTDENHMVQDWEAVTPGRPARTIRMEFKRTGAARPSTDTEAVVRAEVHALNQGNAVALLALFSPDARVFQVSNNPEQLAGELSSTLGTHAQRTKTFTEMLARRPRSHVELLDIASAGDLALVKLKFNDHSDPARSEFVLSMYRVRDGLIQDLWHLVRVDSAGAAAGGRAQSEAEAVVHRLAEVNNRGDVEAFLALFSPHAKNFRNSGEPHTIGDKPSTRMVDQKTRREAYLKMFANGAPAQVQTLGTIGLGNMIAAREVATLPTGKVIDEISIYRVEDGLIQHDWFVYYQERP